MNIQYAWLSEDQLRVENVVWRNPDEVAKLSANKRARLRPLVVDEQPTPSATEAVISSGYIIEPDQVRSTWTLRNKTTAELNAENRAVLLSNILGDNVFTALKTATVAQIETYIDNNFATLLPAQRLLLKTLTKICAYVVRERVGE